MFGQLVLIQSWESRPLLMQCSRCLRFGHMVECCCQQKDLVVCSLCGGAHPGAGHPSNCPFQDKHPGRKCDCTPSCFLCLSQGKEKDVAGHTATSVLCLLHKNFHPPLTDQEGNIQMADVTHKCSTMVLPTPGASGDFSLVTRDDIHCLAATRVSTTNIIKTLVPLKLATLTETNPAASSPNCYVYRLCLPLQTYLLTDK